jgi:hypothetical protein
MSSRGRKHRSRRACRRAGTGRSIVTGATLAVLVTGTTRARGANNWNQWDDDALDGVTEGTTKVGLGVDYARVGPSDHTVRLAAEVEHLLKARWGVLGGVALPVAGEWVAPAWLGVRFHALPKFPLDPFVGLAGGVAWLAPDGLAPVAAPIAAARAGVAFHYFGLFFAQAEGGYDFVQYGREGVTLDLSGASFAGRLGVDF